MHTKIFSSSSCVQCCHCQQCCCYISLCPIVATPIVRHPVLQSTSERARSSRLSMYYRSTKRADTVGTHQQSCTKWHCVSTACAHLLLCDAESASRFETVGYTRFRVKIWWGPLSATFVSRNTVQLKKWAHSSGHASN